MKEQHKPILESDTKASEIEGKKGEIVFSPARGDVKETLKYGDIGSVLGHDRSKFSLFFLPSEFCAPEGISLDKKCCKKEDFLRNREMRSSVYPTFFQAFFPTKTGVNIVLAGGKEKHCGETRKLRSE